jgi:hypothetical protein
MSASPKDDPADVAGDGFEALMAGKERVVASSLRPRRGAAAAASCPTGVKAKMHGQMAEPGCGDQ